MLSRVSPHLRQTFHESVPWSVSIDELTRFWMHIVSSFLRVRHSFPGLLVDRLCLLSGPDVLPVVSRNVRETQEADVCIIVLSEIWCRV